MSIVNYNNQRRRDKLTMTIEKYLEQMRACGKPVTRIQLSQIDCDLLGDTYAGITLESLEGEK